MHWSPSSRTALAEAELEYPEGHTSRSIYVALPITALGERVVCWRGASGPAGGRKVGGRAGDIRGQLPCAKRAQHPAPVLMNCQKRPAPPGPSRAGPSASGPAGEALSGAALAIWTTTPWTIPANLAVAVNADLQYAVVEVEVRCALRCGW